MDIQFGNLSSLNWLWIVAIAIGVMGMAIVARRKALARFATANLIPLFAPKGGTAKHIVKFLLLTGALVAMVLALVDIRWGKTWREVPQRGIEVMFVLDVSRSMLAEDATPNRLERAKQQITDNLKRLKEAGLTMPLIWPPFTDVPVSKTLDDLKVLKEEIMPKVELA